MFILLTISVLVSLPMSILRIRFIKIKKCLGNFASVEKELVLLDEFALKKIVAGLWFAEKNIYLSHRMVF